MSKEDVNNTDINEQTGAVLPETDTAEEAFDYNSIYGIKAKSTAQKKQGDELMREIRREAEMKAIKEDIERRYALELEAAQSKAVSFEAPEVQAQEVVADAEPAVIEPEPAPAPEQNAKAKKHDRKKAADSKQTKSHGEAYELVSSFGSDILEYTALIIGSVLRVVFIPIKAIYGYSEKATGYAAKRARRYAVGLMAEVRHFRREIKSASGNIGRAMRHPAAIPSILGYYIKKAFKRHTGLLKTVFNVSMPVAAILIFAITINFWNGVTFALKVTYNEHEIGYISNEAVYIRAQELVKEKMDTGAFGSDSSAQERTTAVVSAASAQPDLQAQYSLSLVSLEELNDAQTICDRIIENSVDNLTNACGIYIDGEFVCAVKNEADAKTVFDKVIAPYEADASDDNGVVSFVQDIEYVQGLYPDNENVMWDAAHLETTLSGTVERKREYVVARNDSLESIAEDYDMTVDELKAQNPDYDWDNIEKGDTINITVNENLVTVKKTVTATTTETVKYSTDTKRDATKYSGYRKVQQKGQNGMDKVITTTVYIDGKVADITVDRERLVEPVEEIVVIGSNKYYGNIYVGEQSSKGFLWPAPSCHSVSSPYGNRSSGWHKGVDLIRGGGGANGTPVIASRSGTIEVVSYGGSSYGNMILINHGDGYKTRYAHLLSGSIRVSSGDHVQAGQRIASVGSTGNSTGPHLHFEVIYNGSTRNPMNYIG